jgi:hypothetical protein
MKNIEMMEKNQDEKEKLEHIVKIISLIEKNEWNSAKSIWI